MQIILSLNEYQGVTSGINNQIAERLALEFNTAPYAIPSRHRACDDGAILTIGHGHRRVKVLSAKLANTRSADNIVVQPGGSKVTLLLQTKSREIGSAWATNTDVGEHGKFLFCSRSLDEDAIDELIPLIADEVRRQLSSPHNAPI